MPYAILTFLVPVFVGLFALVMQRIEARPLRPDINLGDHSANSQQLA